MRCSELPIWIKEILDNDESIRTVCKPINKGDIFVIKSSRTGTLNKSRSLTKVTFFRDGPFLPISTGAANSIYGMMNALVDKGLDVYLIYSYRGWSSKKLFLDQKFTTILVSPDDFYSNKELLNKLLTKLKINICHFDSAEAVCIQKKLIPANCKIVFEMHNIESDLVQQLGAGEQVKEYVELKEKEAIKISDAVLVRSVADYGSALTLGCGKEKLFKYKGCINVNDICYKERGELLTNKILFLGHLNYQPNQQAVDIIIRKIASGSNKKFVIAGRGGEFLKKLSLENINFFGLVKDLNKLFLNVDIALAPIITGSGTRIKILDYMAAGIPVIGSNMAIEGLDKSIKKCMIVEDDFEKYKDIIDLLYSDKELVKFLSSVGRKYVIENRNWKENIYDVINAYNFLLGK